MTDAEARSFFAAMADAFGSFDAERIADFMYAPLTIVQPTGSRVFANRQLIVENFAGMNTRHRELGVCHIAAENVTVAPTYDDNCVEARLTWRFERQDHSLIHWFRMIYLMGRYRAPSSPAQPSWQVVVAMNLDRAHIEPHAGRHEGA